MNDYPQVRKTGVNAVHQAYADMIYLQELGSYHKVYSLKEIKTFIMRTGHVCDSGMHLFNTQPKVNLSPWKKITAKN